MTGDSPRILVILLGLIGDTMMRVPLVRRLRETWPEARITGLCDPVTAPVLTINPLFDEVLVYERRRLNLLRKAAFYLKLRRAGFDLCVDFYYGSQSPLLAWATGARRRLGPARTATARRLLTHPTPWPLPPVHKMDCHLPILAPLGIDSFVPRWEFPLREADHDGMCRALREAGITKEPGDEDILVVIGAGDLSKRWDDDFMVELLENVAGGAWGDGRRVLLVSDQREPELSARFAGAARGRLLPPLSLPQLGAAMASCALTLVPDTGPMHIALATAPRVLTFFLSTDPELHFAERDAYRRLYHKLCDRQPCDTREKDSCRLECRRSITVVEMLGAGRELLEAPPWDGRWPDSVRVSAIDD